MSGDNNPPRRTGSPWALPSNNGPRIGRVGAWGASPSGSGNGGGASGGRRIATLGDMASSGPSVGGGGGGGRGGHGHGHGGHGHAHGSDDDDDEDDHQDDRGGEDWYAGGERSGISVQNPDRAGARPGGDLVRDLLRRAAEAGPPVPPPGAAPRSNAFFGGGHTLGSDEVDSEFIPDPDAVNAQQEEETAIRHLTFWRDGFTVEDGELMRYDDPANEQILNEINSGRAPPHILNVQPGQPVELRVVKRLTDNYVPSAGSRQAKTFSGHGNRLGSPAPAVAGESSTSVPGAFPGAEPSSADEPPPQRTSDSISARFEVDASKPTTNVQIRLADGSRMVARMNLTHTVGDIRNYINASRPENHARPYVIMTTFPNKTLDDESLTIEAAKLANSVIVQRWE